MRTRGFLNFPDIPLLIMQAYEDKLVDRMQVRKWFNEVDSSDKAYKEWKECYHELFNEYEREQIFLRLRKLLLKCM
ncbi:hypothetical protein GCM10020331_030570 [Ectobacillus funiculus]